MTESEIKKNLLLAIGEFSDACMMDPHWVMPSKDAIRIAEKYSAVLKEALELDLDGFGISIGKFHNGLGFWFRRTEGPHQGEAMQLRKEDLEEIFERYM